MVKILLVVIFHQYLANPDPRIFFLVIVIVFSLHAMMFTAKTITEFNVCRLLTQGHFAPRLPFYSLTTLASRHYGVRNSFIHPIAYS